MKIEQVKFILMVQDMDRAVAFWRDTVGLTQGMVSPYWSELRHGDTMVALHGGGDGSFRPTGLGLQVDDIEEATGLFAAGGAAVRMPPTERPREGIKIADLTDPEGNGFGVSQLIK